MKREVKKRVGDKDSQGISRTESQLDTSTSFLDDSFSYVGRKTRYKDVPREAEERLELGNWEFQLPSSYLFWNPLLFFMDDNLKTFTFPADAVQRGSPKVPSKEPGVGGTGWRWGRLCGDSILSYLKRKWSFLFSEVYFRTEMNCWPFPGTASAQLQLGSISPEWR